MVAWGAAWGLGVQRLQVVFLHTKALLLGTHQSEVCLRLSTSQTSFVVRLHQKKATPCNTRHLYSHVV